VTNVYDKNTIIVDVRYPYFLVRRQRRRHRIPENITVESDVSRGSDDKSNDVINIEFGQENAYNNDINSEDLEDHVINLSLELRFFIR